jgi:phenylpyruvate tautomerase PptA (4-oxalocrotonate tautomerase family)
MPMLDAFIPEGALNPLAEAQLLNEITDILLTSEGFDPANEKARAVSVIWLHRPHGIYVAGERSTTRRYRFIPSVPEGQYNDEARAYVVREITAAVARAEGADFDSVSPRVWVFPVEVPEGWWGGQGRIVRLSEILTRIGGEPKGVGERKIADRRRTEATAILRAAASETSVDG